MFSFHDVKHHLALCFFFLVNIPMPMLVQRILHVVSLSTLYFNSLYSLFLIQGHYVMVVLDLTFQISLN